MRYKNILDYIPHIILTLAIAAVVGLVSCERSYAAAQDYAYVIVKCTVSLSVQVVAPSIQVYTSTPNAGAGISAGQVFVSSYVTVQNNGSGCIETWTLQVSSQDYCATAGGSYIANDGSGAAWALGSTIADNGINKVVLAACFKSADAIVTDFSPASNNENMLKWFVPVTWGSGAFDVGATSCYQPNSNAYTQDYVNGSGHNNVAAGNLRNLFFYVKAPTAVTDQMYHRFMVMVTAAVGL